MAKWVKLPLAMATFHLGNSSCHTHFLSSSLLLALEKQRQMAQLPGVLPPLWMKLLLLAIAWSNAAHFGYLGSESMDGRSLSMSFFLCNSTFENEKLFLKEYLSPDVHKILQLSHLLAHKTLAEKSVSYRSYYLI